MESRVERLYRRHAPIYDLTRRWLLPGRRRAVERLGIRPGDDVIDFACGTGLNFPLVRRAGAGAIVGVDLSRPMLDRARRKYPDVNYLLADLVVADVGRSAPRVICSYGLSLVPDPCRGLRNLHRHVAPEGTLVVLDFGRPEGLGGKILETWLSGFGARAPAGVAELMRVLFEGVACEPVLGGVAEILRGSGPRPVRIA